MLAMLLTFSSVGPVECLMKRSRSDRPIVARGRVIADLVKCLCMQVSDVEVRLSRRLVNGDLANSENN